MAFEAGIWVPEPNEVWFTNSIVFGSTTVHVLELSNNNVRIPELSGPIVNPNGDYHWNGLVYFTTVRDDTAPSSVVTVKPATGEVKTVVNSYFGL